MAMATRDLVLTAPVRGRFLGVRIRSASANIKKSRSEISVFASSVYASSSHGHEEHTSGRFSRTPSDSYGKFTRQRDWKNPRPFLPSKPFTPNHPRRDEHGNMPANMPAREYSTDVGSADSSHWSRKHLEEQEHARRVRPPRMPRQHLELPSPKYPNRLQQGFASRGVERLEEKPSYELPFEFQYSYSEVPKQEPVAERGPQFSPFGPDSMPRPWTGKRPLPPSRKKHHEIDSFNPPPPGMKGVKPVEPAGPFLEGQRPVLATTREEVLGEPLTPEEIADLVVACNKEHRLVNLGRDGLTHNMLDLIHNHWKRRRVLKIRCKGVPTVDMDNVCFHLEDKTGGKIIRRQGGCVYLFRGRNYNPKFRPHIPLMLWKPPVPIYPRLIEQAPAGLSVEYAEYLRRRGRQVKPLTTLSRNGVYLSLAKDVKSAFEVDELVKIDCKGMHSSDIRKIGAKLKETLGIVLLSFERECILMWRGPEKRTEDDKALEQFIFQSVSDGIDEENALKQEKKPQNGGPRQHEFLLRSAQELDKLWEKAVNFGMVVKLEDNQLDADTVKSIAGGPVKVVRPLTLDEEEEAEEERRYEEYKRNQERQMLDKRLASPLIPSPAVGHLPVDELAKLLSSPP